MRLTAPFAKSLAILAFAALSLGSFSASAQTEVEEAKAEMAEATKNLQQAILDLQQAREELQQARQNYRLAFENQSDTAYDGTSAPLERGVTTKTTLYLGIGKMCAEDAAEVVASDGKEVLLVCSNGVFVRKCSGGKAHPLLTTDGDLIEGRPSALLYNFRTGVHSWSYSKYEADGVTLRKPGAPIEITTIPASAKYKR